MFRAAGGRGRAHGKHLPPAHVQRVDTHYLSRLAMVRHRGMNRTEGTTMNSSQTGTKKKARRVIIVDDHPIVRQGLRRLIDQEDDLTVCGEAESVREARQLMRELIPDVLIV